jgi:nucleoside-diphosphate-sugar epimerase
MIIYNGATGCIGSYMPYALEREQIHGVSASSRLEDPVSLGSELRRISPKENVAFVHLAAMVDVNECENNKELARETNIAGATNAAKVFHRWASLHRGNHVFIFASTGHVYSRQNIGTMCDETTGTDPASVYAKSKLRAERELLALSKSCGLTVIVCRIFGLVAPIQRDNYMLPGIIRHVKNGDEIGGAGETRDYTDARDVCMSIAVLAKHGYLRTGIVNICSGVGIKIIDIAKMVSDEIGKPINGGVSGGLFGYVVGNPSKYISLTQKIPASIGIRQTIKEACDYQEKREQS